MINNKDNTKSIIFATNLLIKLEFLYIRQVVLKFSYFSSYLSETALMLLLHYFLKNKG
ncbi:Hypothetical protein MCYN_0489 [Mycoplasmopsis cynos C142]|uniref:Uncharacterized protein n=1 Tax=Mycoplasmopsis cynos (strain C142) TaxID=1246955 RepID=L0RXA2_MYCC1|nr:Hypothetical protein MCYN_0489 [Mycoplasmopsis cynos C142]